MWIQIQIQLQIHHQHSEVDTSLQIQMWIQIQLQLYQHSGVGIFVLNIDNWHSSILNLTHLQSCGPRTMAEWLPTERMRQGMFDNIISKQPR